MEWTNNNDTNIHLAARGQHVGQPTIYSRSYVEAGTYLRTPRTQHRYRTPYIVIGNHLAATLGFRRPYLASGGNPEHYERWQGPLPDAIEFIRQHVRAYLRPFSKQGRLYSLPAGDGLRAARILLPELFQDLNTPGAPIATVPNGDSIYVCGSQHAAGLWDMARLTREGLRDKFPLSGMAFRLEGDAWKPWLPPADHPVYREFHELYLESLERAYRAQKAVLLQRHDRENAARCVASFITARNKVTGDYQSYSTWPEGVPTLLPETSTVIFSRPAAVPQEQVVGYGDWNTVRRLAGDLMEPQGMYPERWLVREHPSAAVLSQLRCPREPLEGWRQQSPEFARGARSASGHTLFNAGGAWP